jgi:excisionase family DNA binding protein
VTHPKHSRAHRCFGKAMTAEQLADLLGISEVTIYKHAKANKISSFRVGTCVRFCPKAVADWMGAPMKAQTRSARRP